MRLLASYGALCPVCRGTVAGFASRWSEIKPKAGPSGNPAVVLSKIEEYAASIQELREESAKLQKVRVISLADKGPRLSLNEP